MREIAEGAPIIWPVKEQFLSGFQYAYPHVMFISEKLIAAEIFLTKEIKEIGGVIVLPIRFAEWMMGRQYREHMKSKYDLFEIDWRTWKKDAMPRRDYQKENALMKELGIEKGEPFNLISTTFGSEAQFEIKINHTDDFKNIEMKIIPGYDLFNWCGVIENAENIYAVSSSTLYLFEILTLKAKQVHLFPRKPVESNFDFVSFLFTKNYVLHE